MGSTSGQLRAVREWCPNGVLNISLPSHERNDVPQLAEWTTVAPTDKCRKYLELIREKVSTEAKGPDRARTLKMDGIFQLGSGHISCLIYKCERRPVDLGSVLRHDPKPSSKDRCILGRTIATQVRSLAVHSRMSHGSLRTESFVFFKDSADLNPHILDWARRREDEIYQPPHRKPGLPTFPDWLRDVWSLTMVLSEVAEWQPLESNANSLERRLLITDPTWKGPHTANVFDYCFQFFDKVSDSPMNYSLSDAEIFYNELCDQYLSLPESNTLRGHALRERAEAVL